MPTGCALIHKPLYDLGTMGTRSSRTARLNEAAPAVALVQADGSPWTLASAHGAGPVVLVFLRGFF